MPKLALAAGELRQLLNCLAGKGYEKTALLRLVGDRHQLEKDERNLLYRAVWADEDAARRHGKLVAPSALKGRRLAIDGHNVLITVESALAGRDLVLADDGLVRDIAGVFGGYRSSDTTEVALGHIFALLREAAPSAALFFFDAPLSGSGALAARVRGLLSAAGLPGDARAVPAPAKSMLEQGEVMATSDSVVIDRSAAVCDLAGHIAVERLGRRPRVL